MIGGALRRQSYRVNEEGRLSPEYADILGIPFDFTAKPVIAKPTAPHKTVRVEAVRPDRDALEIRFPRVEGYRTELPEERLTAKFTADHVLELTPDLVGPSITKNQGGVVAFHCQQAVEKLLKGFLTLAGKRGGKTHSLTRLDAVAAASFPELADLVAAAQGWSDWAFDFRYPAERGRRKPLPDEDELRRALAVIDALATRLRAANPDPPGP